MASQSMTEVRAALSEREPEGPTDIELLSMAGTAIGHEIEFGEYEPETECAVEAYGSELIDFARAVLARWGRPAPQPVPVSERWPGPEDCDGEGRCWWGEPQIGDSHDATWNLCTQDEAEDYCTWGTKCGWLPANALPLPAFLDGDCDKTATPEDQ